MYIPSKPGEGEEKVPPDTKNILVRGIPRRVHKAMKMEAVRQDKTLSELVKEAFIFYLKNGRPRQAP